MKHNEAEDRENEIVDEYYDPNEDPDRELMAESQGSNKNKWLFVLLGIIFSAVVAGIFYTLLKDTPPPIEVKPIKRVSVKSKEFIQPMVRKKEEVSKPKPLPMLPNMPAVVPVKHYIPKLIKGGGGKLDISQKTKNTPTVPPQPVAVAQKEPEVKKIKAYRGGSSTVAGMHHYNPNLSLQRGTLIPCSMNTRLISMVSGQISCTVSEDMYSVNGNVLLIEKGSIAVGTYKSETLRNGMNRIYAIWDDIRTPNNIVISVGSAAADELGSNGMVGEIDNHWAMRFGGAILLSIIDDSLSMLTQQNTQQGGFIISNTSSNMSRMGEMALKQYIDIPPTLYKNHGDLINIFLNKDIDFSEAYSLER